MKKLRIPANLTSLAYRSIKEYILQGHVDDDRRLTEESLASQLGISKSPIREALNRLETEGLIRIEPRRGAYLRRFSIQETRDLYDLREALEVHAVRTVKITPELLSELRVSLGRQRAFLHENDKAHYIEEDAAFHTRIVEATGNTLLLKQIENLQNLIWLTRRKTYDLSSSTAPDAHEEIVAALDRGDRCRAEEAMRGHIIGVRERLVRYLQEEPRVEMNVDAAGTNAYVTATVTAE
jgi:DNA-binding GntR family transcriptional regulator